MTDKRSGGKKLWKWITAVVITMIAIIGGASLYLSLTWKPILIKKIKEVVYNGSEQLYRIDFKDIHLNLLSGSVTVDSILLAPDTTVFNARKKLGTAPVHLFQVKLARLRLRRIGVLKVYFQKKIDMDDIILENPSINMMYNRFIKKLSLLRIHAVFTS